MRNVPEMTWKAKAQVDPAELKALQAQLDLDPKILTLLLQRGIKSLDQARQFFKPSLEELHDPFLMKDMDRAVDRVNRALKANEKIMIYGDYDVDGTTSVAMLANFMQGHYANFITYIPDRYREGYGVSKAGIDRAHAENASLIIALDCGIKALDKVEYAQSLGIDFIICDHHTPGPELPAAAAVLDPKRKDCSYPYKGLSGCGVGFKLAQALSLNWQIDSSECWKLLDLLALSIGADIVPMTGENRVLAYYGLEKINSDPSEGIQALLRTANQLDRRLSIGDVVFTLAPRINAAGRLAHAQQAVDLLRGTDLSLLPEIAAEIEIRNQDRKNLDRQITKEALRQIEEKLSPNAVSTVVFQEDWHKGVIGIVASRLIESHYRPTVVLTLSGDKLAGSARSVEGFDLYDALEACEDSLIQFGGHAAAAGMTLKPEQLDEFKMAFEESVKARITEEQKQARLIYDLDIDASDIDAKFYRLIQRFAPFGPENLAPLLRCRNLIDRGSRTVGDEAQHLKISVVDPDSGLCLEGIGFNLGPKLELLQSQQPVALLFHLELNVFRGQASLQLRVLDIKAESELED
ncbi:single-stranded-DNA-specific exonuclease RecJ [Croceimicrobium sp.]|uniref:single-stranded-DNA-specific exonuclease RecJ n=1 Tax=Croceimicrobium sp. TaxID=2828340 RepID=UPI003BAB7C74